MSRQSSLFHVFIRSVTFGVVNPGKDGVIFKDPLTGVGNILAQGRDAFLKKNKNQGVWIGKRTVAGIGFSSYLTEHFNRNMLQYAFRINGKEYCVKRQADDQGRLNSQILPLQQAHSQDYQWFFKGETKRDLTDIENLVQLVNNKWQQKNIISEISSQTSKTFVYFAIGSSFYSKEQVIAILIERQCSNQFLAETFNAITSTGSTKNQPVSFNKQI